MDTEKIKRKIIGWGANLVGFGDLKDYIPESLGDLKNAISIAVCLSNTIINKIIHGPTKEYAYHYHVVNSLLDEIALKTTNLLQSMGYKAFPIPVSQTINRNELKGIIPHKTAATRAGLGWIGKNALLVTPEFGPRVRLVTVLTNYPFKLNSPYNETQCGDCNKCVEICPLKAIKGNNWQVGLKRSELIDVFLCSKLIEENKKTFKSPICGQCMAICPVGLKIGKLIKGINQ